MNDADRRRFFRIKDTVGLSYRILSDAEAQSQGDLNTRPTNVPKLLSAHDKTIHRVLGQLKIQQPLVAELLEAFDEKINCVVRQLEIDSQLVEQIAHKIQEVNISACGVAFNIDESIAIGKVLFVDLVLLPENIHIYTHGSVVMRSAVADGEGYYIRVNFSGMDTLDQELLIQYIVQRQAVQLRSVNDI
jgi:c-di-GMP-binding flagellar brake protein YcgR